LGRLKGSVLRAGRNYLPLGAEGERAYQVAAEKMPRLGATYLRASEDVARAEVRLAASRRQLE
jgi:hypothetical protein